MQYCDRLGKAAMGDQLEPFGFLGADGVPIAGDARGPAEGLPVILSPGGGQTRFAWGRGAARLADAGFRAVSLDLRGHGESGWANDGYTIDDYAEDLRRAMELFDRPALLVGASLGGLASLIAAGEGSGRAPAGLCLVDVSPHLKSDGVEGILGFMRRTTDGFATLEAAADAVAGYLPHRPPPSDLDGLRKNLRHGDDGRWRWHWDPRTIDPPLDPVTINPRLEAAADRITAPALLLRGALSELVTREVAESFMARFADGHVLDIPGARHMVAGDRNDIFGDALIDFARRVRGNGVGHD